MNPENPLLNYAVVGLYFVFLASIGIVFKKLNTNENDYFRAGSRGTWWMVGMSAFMSSISTQTFIANSGVAFRSGFSIHWVYIVNAVCYIILALGIAAWYRQSRVTTFPEIVRDRFGPGFQQFFTWYNIIWLMFAGGIGLYMLSLFAHTVFGFSLRGMILMLGFVVLFYTLTDGNWAVLAADFLQSLVLLTMALLMAVLALMEIGGVSGFFEAIEARNLSNDFAILTRGGEGGNYGLEWLIGVGIVQVYAILGITGAQRYFSAMDGREARRAAMFCCAVSIFGMAIYFIPPMVARLLHEQEVLAIPVDNPSDVAYAFMSMRLLPLGFVPLMAVAMFSAQMSSMDTALNANSAMFVKNAYPALMRLMGREPSTNHKFLLLLGRCFTIFLGCGLVSSALYFSANAGDQGIFELVFKLNAIALIPMFLPMFLGLYIKRTPWWSGWFCIAFGLACSATCAILGLPTFRIALLNSLVGFLAFIATIPFWNRSSLLSRERIEEFFRRIHTPVDFAAEIGVSNSLQQLKMVGILACCLGVFLHLFLLFPNPPIERLQVWAVAATVLAMGLLLLFLQRQGRCKLAEAESTKDNT